MDGPRTSAMAAKMETREDNYKQDSKDDLRSNSVISPHPADTHGIDAEIAEFYKDQVGGVAHTVGQSHSLLVRSPPLIPI